jgi:hypothetical protein
MPFRLRHAALAVAAALSACSGTAPATAPVSSTALGVGGHAIRFGDNVHNDPSRRGWLSRPALTGPVIYAASYDGGFINIYPLKGNNQAPIGQLTNGLQSPQGVFVDGHHHLWVANTNAFSVVGFKRGAATPYRTLNDPNYYPISVVEDTSGTVYAANAESTTGPPGNVTYWLKGKTNPSGTLTFGNFLIVTNIGIDASNNVYVSYIPMSGPPAVVEFPAGSHTGQQLAIQDANLSDITFDKSNNLVMETLSNELGVWEPPYTSGPSRIIPAFGNEPTLDKNNGKVWIAYANYSTPMVEGYSYKTGVLKDTITQGFSSTGVPFGIAIDPPTPR